MNDFDLIIRNSNLDDIFENRRRKVYEILRQKNIGAAVFEDSEDFRDPSIRYLTGHPSDALLILTCKGESTLICWDENLANQKAHADKILPYNNYGRKNTNAVQEILKNEIFDHNVLALSPNTTYPLFNEYVEAMKNWTVECKKDSIHSDTENLRACKDDYEIACTKKACSITSTMTDQIIQMLTKGKISTEMDVALFIERSLREMGCEKTSFDTLAAGPNRSFAIHAFPGYTNGSWGSNGISLLDYGVCYEGYASDATITVAKGKMSPKQNLILDLVQKAADECIHLYKAGLPISQAVKKADEIFASEGLKMPHGLGHGIGLEIHENPFVSSRSGETKEFKVGNIVTLEPGLYDPELGGCRLENDVLITQQGNQILTNSKIFRI